VRSLDGTEKSHEHVPHALEQCWQLFQHLAATQFLETAQSAERRHPKERRLAEEAERHGREALQRWAAAEEARVAREAEDHLVAGNAERTSTEGEAGRSANGQGLT
jgi:hypothetical protein